MRISAIVIRIIKQFLRDKRSFALLFIAPLLVLTLIWLVLDGNEYEPAVAYDTLPPFIEEIFHSQFSGEIEEMSETEANAKFQDGELDAFITFENMELSIILEGSNPTANGAVLKNVQDILKSLNKEGMGEPNISYYYGSEDINIFDQAGSVLVAFLVFFFVFILGGISFLRERTQGTLEKLLSTPIRRWEIVTGYLLGFGLFTVIQSVIILVYSVYVLDIWMAGDFWQLLIVTLLLAITALTLATFLSAFANNEFQMMQFIPLVILPQVFFSGLFPLDTLDRWIQIISKFMPLTYGADAMKEIMIKGNNIWDIWIDLFVIFGFAIVFFVLNILALKKHRRL